MPLELWMRGVRVRLECVPRPVGLPAERAEVGLGSVRQVHVDHVPPDPGLDDLRAERTDVTGAVGGRDHVVTHHLFNIYEQNREKSNCNLYRILFHGKSSPVNLFPVRVITVNVGLERVLGPVVPLTRRTEIGEGAAVAAVDVDKVSADIADDFPANQAELAIA